jgi:hypothetical protein
MTIDELSIEVHFVKENVVLSEDSRSSEKFMHGIKVLMAKNYIDNLGEEVRKGMIEKARQGHWPTVAPVGYRNNLATHRIEPDPERAPIIAKLFEWYASGEYSLKALTKKAAAVGLTNRTGGTPLVKAKIHQLLQNPIYHGDFYWLGQLHQGVHKPIISRDLFARVQDVFAAANHSKHTKRGGTHSPDWSPAVDAVVHSLPKRRRANTSTTTAQVTGDRAETRTFARKSWFASSVRFSSRFGSRPSSPASWQRCSARANLTKRSSSEHRCCDCNSSRCCFDRNWTGSTKTG